MTEENILGEENTGNVKQSQNDDAYFRSIIENNSFYIIKTDLEGNYSYLNPFFCKMLSVTPEEYIGKNSLSLILSEDHAICIETVERCFAQPDQSHWVMLRKPVPNGALFTQWEFKILKDELGNPVELLCIGHDITPLILKQEELRNMVDVAAEQNKRLVNFTYIISHNIRSHVANILGILNISQELADHDLALGLIQESTTSLNEILSNLNEIISIQAHTSLPIVEVNVFEQINRIVQSIQILLNRAGTKIDYKFEENQVMQTNPAYFESIILNLITNAVKYKSPERDLQITISLNAQEQYKVLTFQDNGLGIDIEKYRDQLFGMYKTFHKNNDSRGLGLYITKTQIEAMNGRIEVESTVGIGTTFKLYFNQKIIKTVTV
ncbi:PAS domain-containing sensor histidine kinase [Dyadobacter sp. CY356]|uniref:PAS domain-containing sensor histidine kinase n=1 Tax=Dyadobacter sp. CY356 TaxID=2906442 RepID=UPI001F24DB3D|nr:PAS domain-containing sensor histidine kinase [Dyadobacter sp. CY356]MCF0055130.1 PAS domain-containing sensor histidine kinase [Dyadobacter sp. CY356]